MRLWTRRRCFACAGRRLGRLLRGALGVLCRVFFGFGFGSQSPVPSFIAHPNPCSRPIPTPFLAIGHSTHPHTHTHTLTPTYTHTHTNHPPSPHRLLIRFKLRQEPAPTPGDAARTVWVIAEQEDFYHPDALVAMFVPPLAPFVRWALGVGAAACRVGAGVLRGLGC